MVADPLSFDGGEAVEFKDALRRASIDDLKEIEDVEEWGRRGKLEEDVGGTRRGWDGNGKWPWGTFRRSPHTVFRGV